MRQPAARDVSLPDGHALAPGNPIHRRWNKNDAGALQPQIISSFEMWRLMQCLALGDFQFESIGVLARLIYVEDLDASSVTPDQTKDATFAQTQRKASVAFDDPEDARLPAPLVESTL